MNISDLMFQNKVMLNGCLLLQKEQFGTLHGVFHSAGVLRDSFILRKTKEEIDQVTGSKVFGTLWLAEEIKK